MSDWVGYKNYDHYFNMQTPNDTILFLAEAVSTLTVSSKGNVDYFNIPASFDIETYSTYKKGRKFATMYVWQFGLNGSVIIGRTWNDFLELLDLIRAHIDVNLRQRLIIYVHNLGYEFQFMRKWIKWHTLKDGNQAIFSLKERRPIYALSEAGFEFRCSYILSNYSLLYLGSKMLFKYKVEKLVGDLDYTKPRNFLTPLTEQEIAYCVNDVRVVMSYIQEQIEQYGNIARIPLTNTGRVRQFTRDYVNGSYTSNLVERKKISCHYYDIMTALQITSQKEYDMCKGAFAGGFTHANGFKVGEDIYNVGSADLTSSYPAVMVMDYYPMSRAKYVSTLTNDEFLDLASEKCCIFLLTLYDVVQKFDYESYISVSRCVEISENHVENNGRVVSADYLSIPCTEIDFEIIAKVYDLNKYNWKVSSIYYYERGYLPRDLIKAILIQYGKKTKLKGVDGKEVEYNNGKNMQNSMYGMIVTDIVRDEIIYNIAGWDKDRASAVDNLVDYNHSFNRFLFYPWGIYVTAHARHNVWEAIFEFGEDYVYCDTDSVKGENFDKHLDFFKQYNDNITSKLCRMCAHYQIPWDEVAPKTIKGKEKPIGFWDIEKPYKQFKTLGAKRYLYEYENGEFNMTVAGVNKTVAVPYLLWKYCGFDKDNARMAYSPDPRLEDEQKKALSILLEEHKTRSYQPAFDAFDVDLEIPPGEAGKNTHSYIDQEMCELITDEFDNSVLCYEKSAIHMEPAGYNFSLSDAFIAFLAEHKTIDSF